MRPLLLLPLAFLPALPATSPFQESGRTPVEAEPTLLSAVPEDAILALWTDRWDAIRARGKENSWVRFLQDESWGFGGVMQALLDEAADEMPEDAPRLEEVIGAIEGGVAAFLRASDTPEDPSFGVLIEVDPSNDVLLGHFDKLVDLAAEEIGAASSDTYNGANLDILESELGDEAAVWLDVEGLVGMTFGPTREIALETAQGVVDRWTGSDESKGYAGNELAPGGGPTPAFTVQLDLPRLMESLGETFGDDEEEEALMEAVGVTAIEWVALSADIGEGEELELSLSAHIPSGNLIGNLLDHMGPMPVDYLDLMPSDSLSVALGAFDLWGMWTTIKDFMREYAPDDLEEMEAGLAAGKDEMGFDIEQDLLAQITGRFASFNMAIPPSEMPELAIIGIEEIDPSMAQGGAFLIELKDPQAVQRMVNSVLEAQGMAEMVVAEDFQGVTIHSMDLGFLRPHYAFLPEGVVISMYPTPMRAMVRQSGAEDAPNAGQNEKFSSALESFGGSSMVTLSDTQAWVSAILGTLGMLSAFVPELGTADLFTPPDPSLAETYFSGTTVFALTRDGDVFELWMGTL